MRDGLCFVGGIGLDVVVCVVLDEQNVSVVVRDFERLLHQFFLAVTVDRELMVFLHCCRRVRRLRGRDTSKQSSSTYYTRLFLPNLARYQNALTAKL